MNKQALRMLTRERAGVLGEEYFRDAGRRICEHVARWEVYRGAHVVMGFVSTALEPDTRPLLEMALKDGKVLALPKIVGPGVMEARQVTDLGRLVRGPYGIMEPEEDAPAVDRADIGLVLAPCVTCDRYGRRLGHGGGYYDRFLRDFSGNAIVVLGEKTRVERVPAEDHDVPMTAYVTEEGLFCDHVGQGFTNP